MTRAKLTDHISEYYGGESLAGDTARRLAALAQADRAAVLPMRSVDRASSWPLRLVGVAASLALIVSSVSLYAVYRRVSDVPILDRDALAAAMDQRHGPLTHAANSPRLVAMKFQVEGCPKAAAVEPAFSELLNKYCDDAVFFARYDMTDEQRRRWSMNTARSLGVEWACRGVSQSGTIMLIDRETGKTLATLTDCSQLPKMERTIEQALR